MDYQTIKYEIEENILTITLNRPEKLNAFNNEMLEELLDHLFIQKEIENNPKICQKMNS